MRGRPEGLVPTAADRGAYVDRMVAAFEKFPAGGVEFAVRRIAADVGLAGYRDYVEEVRERVTT